MRAAARFVLALPLMVVAACGSSGGPRADIPSADRKYPTIPQAEQSRAQTGGEPLLALVPAGAELVVELDLERLRANVTVGPVVTRVAAVLGQQYDGLAGADLIVLCSYGIGTTTAQTLTIARGPQLPDPGDRGKRLDEQTVALGPSGLVARIGGDGLASDDELMRFRAFSMPERAAGASVRLTAVLSFEARVAVARDLDVDAVPSGVSVWGDVADDLAVVAVLSGDDSDDAKALAVGVESAQDRLLENEFVTEWFLGYLIRGITVTRAGNLTQVVFLVGPRALQLVSERLGKKLEQ